MEEMITEIYAKVIGMFYGQMVINGIILFLLGFIFIWIIKNKF